MRLKRAVKPFVPDTILADRARRYEAAPVLRLLGLYEYGLRPVLSELVGQKPRRVVNLGSADGWYAVGMALTDSCVDAYDISRSARKATGHLAKLNGVAERVHVHGRMRTWPSVPDAVICDIEGAEDDVFTAPRCALGRS